MVLFLNQFGDFLIGYLIEAISLNNLNWMNFILIKKLKTKQNFQMSLLFII